jgi:hypothetical protein
MFTLQLNPKSQNNIKAKKKTAKKEAQETGRMADRRLTPHSGIMSGVGQSFRFSELSDSGIADMGL